MTTSKNTLTLVIAAGVLVALLAGAGAGWLARGAEIARLNDKVASLEDQLAALEGTEDTGTAEPLPDEETTAVVPAPGAGVNERQPGYVKSVVTAGGVTTLTIDYVQFLTGGAAADAAALHGDESPPPNDYYIVNDNPKLREFPVQPDIKVMVVTFDDGTSDAAGHAITLTKWMASLSGPYGPAFKSSLYWVTITDGKVTAIEAQYLP